MLNNKIIGLFVLGLALSSPLRNANAVIESPTLGLQTGCWETDGCKDGYTLSDDGTKCVESNQAETCDTLVAPVGVQYYYSAGTKTCTDLVGNTSNTTINNTYTTTSGKSITCAACCDYNSVSDFRTAHPNMASYTFTSGLCPIVASCNDGYSLSADGKCVAASGPCNPSTYDAFLSALSNSACTTVTLAATIDGQDDSNATNLEVPANKVINGNGKTLKMSRTLSLGGSTNIENLTLINHTRDAIYIASGADTLNGVKIETVGVGININMPYMMSGTNTIKVYGSNAVGISAPNNSSILSMLSGTLDINASNGATGIQLSNEYSEIVVDSGATLNINIMDGYAIASTGGLLNIDGTLNIDHDGPQSPVYGTSSTLTIEGEGDINIVTNSIADTINVASLEVLLEGTLNIEAPVANGAYFIKSANGSFYFYSGDSELITKSTGSRTFSSTDVGLKINVVETSPNAIWHVIGSGYSNRWKAYNDLDCMSGYNKTYPTNSCWLNTSLSTNPT